MRQLSRPLSMLVRGCDALVAGDRRRGRRRHITLSIQAICVGSLLVSCASHERFASPPRVLEVYSERRVATVHFPRGTYLLATEDRRGYYYEAPGGVVEHTAAGRVRRKGGIFVSKRDRDKLRGYVIMPYGRTHVGNLSRVEHEFRESVAPAEGPELPQP
jgi:hypothetical protein